MKQINGNVEWKIITKLNINSTAFFELEESEPELRTETEEQWSSLGEHRCCQWRQRVTEYICKGGGFMPLEILFRTEPRPKFCCHICLKNFLPGQQSCYH